MTPDLWTPNETLLPGKVVLSGGLLFSTNKVFKHEISIYFEEDHRSDGVPALLLIPSANVRSTRRRGKKLLEKEETTIKCPGYDCYTSLRRPKKQVDENSII